MLELNKLLEVVEKVSAVQSQERTLLYSSDFQKSALEQYLNVKINSDDYTIETFIGKVRLLKTYDVGEFINTRNQIFVIDVI